MKSIYLILTSVLLGVFGQLSMKHGMMQLGVLKINFLTLIKTIFSPFVFLGLSLYALSSIIWLIVLSRVDLSVAYPMLSLGYVLVVLFSWLLFKEPLTSAKGIGILFIFFGVYMIGTSM